MSYTHYYEWDAPLKGVAEKFPLWSQEMALILDEVQRRGILEWDTEDGNIVITEPDFVVINGPAKDDQGHEAFYLSTEICQAPLNWQQFEHRPFCKTAGKPYDIAVVAALIQFNKHFPEAKIRSNGGTREWQSGFELCQDIFGKSAGSIPATIEIS